MPAVIHLLCGHVITESANLDGQVSGNFPALAILVGYGEFCDISVQVFLLKLIVIESVEATIVVYSSSPSSAETFIAIWLKVAILINEAASVEVRHKVSSKVALKFLFPPHTVSASEVRREVKVILMWIEGSDNLAALSPNLDTCTSPASFSVFDVPP